ncbi:MAG: flagellar assembly peptidoglycan hydrolase FlgJ [Gammaproteobacteria bacterium]|nr:flagellar assembly peptidoglycan hydrolase FlgJ [Gammaproteobacteria bacterium]
MISDISSVHALSAKQDIENLKQAARDNDPEAVREVAVQFEALFMQMMMKSMREAQLGDGLFDSEQSKLYQGMFDEQLSGTMVAQRGMGLADMLVRQLGGAKASSDPATASLTFPERIASNSPTMAINSNAIKSETKGAVKAPDFDSPQQFLDSLWPHAQRAGKQLGVNPEAILAQAALESGWGQSVMQRADGGSSHNLFGIKADRRWSGDALSVPTLEYSDGLAVQQRANFRAYDSYAASFDDYANFLRADERYEAALKKGDDAFEFGHALQRAGYATDPTYGNKIGTVLKSDIFSEFRQNNSSVD